MEDLLAAGRAGRMQVISVAATTTAAAAVQPLLPPGTELLVADPSVLSSLAGFPFHRGLMACAAVPSPPPFAELAQARRLLVLPRLYDSENLGLLLRSAAALGLDGVLAGPGPGLWSRRTVRVSMGAVWRIPVWHAEDPWPPLAHWQAAEVGTEVVAAALTPPAEDARAWHPGAPLRPGDGSRGHGSRRGPAGLLRPRRGHPHGLRHGQPQRRRRRGHPDVPHGRGPGLRENLS